MIHNRSKVLNAIAAEREVQDAEFGPKHDDKNTAQQWSAIRGRFDNMQVRAESPAARIRCLVKIAAVAVAQIEAVQRSAAAEEGAIEQGG